MIGGKDVVIPAVDDPNALDACARIIQRYWPAARFEDALTGEKYHSLADLPNGGVEELLVYADESAEAGWDAGDADFAANTMIYLIRSPNSVTAVVDDPSTAEMQQILDSMREVLRMDACRA